MLDHINIVVADLERAAHFYETVFGFTRGFSATLEGDWIATVTGLERASRMFISRIARWRHAHRTDSL